jgi:hypothetical protein
MPVGIILSLIDIAGHTSKVIRYAADGLPNQGRYLAMARNFAEVVDAVSKCRVKSATVTFNVALTGLKSAPTADSDVEEQAHFNFIGENGFPSRMSIPGFDEDKIDPVSRLVDLTDSDVENLVDAMVDGLDDDDSIATNLQDVVDARGDDLTELESAYEYHAQDRGRGK